MFSNHPPDRDQSGALLALYRRELSDEQIRRFEGYAAEIFAALGMDVDAPSTQDTPKRFIRALYDATTGYDGDPKLLTVFETECHGGPDCELSQIVEGPIRFYALCEHHALPFYGNAYIGYIAHEHIIGISKLTRLARLFARRFTVQERMGREIAEALVSILHPHGIAVYLEAHHMCTRMRGVRDDAAMTRTTHWRGEYEHNAALRNEFFIAAGLNR